MGLTVELAQIYVKPGDVEGNLEKHLKIIQNSNADCIVFPELSLTGYISKDAFYNSSKLALSGIQKIKEIVDRKQNCVIVGIPREVRPGIFRNSASVIRNGRKPFFIDKFYLANYELFDEKRYFQPGDLRTAKTFSFNGKRLGVVVCEDAWHPEPIELLSRKGAEAIFIISASPLRLTGKDIRDNWRSLIVAHSLMNSVWVIFVNMVGQGDEEYFWGGSMVSSPSGKITLEMKELEEMNAITVIDINENRISRLNSGFKDHRSEFHRYLSKL
ncbi:nitrilase-related carbon-nitrogen hydrolase [Sulfuracidifex metallicus]|uniref:Amidohydrolase n=1 Tax=Sulfuracidifex metallicus DSM 6482 = JCM 9184 TaxID=523847 RepID=A0A6A9QQB1_SULME|nr:nitrilase-related carbon-nitrogen hydrolase [Sulfuracidifex metallicus]MUN29475.1 amidohydrolase [Sulfuracidifex metallicus DSM 6482 = JCM 9184]WOE50015.1 nitrilase-related carbon-nitrogen hydrolase [Sulfuracidifex metallicus DSM 6482 = JCM 9184]